MIDRLLVSHGFGIIRYLPFLQGIYRREGDSQTQYLVLELLF
jgi:hypothetical protein